MSHFLLPCPHTAFESIISPDAQDTSGIGSPARQGLDRETEAQREG